MNKRIGGHRVGVDALKKIKYVSGTALLNQLTRGESEIHIGQV
jgi:hypothetical protein